MPADEQYPVNLHLGDADRTERSARLVVPIVMELCQPKSVVDVGCGTGIWLSVFRDLGVTEIHGVDGEYASLDQLRIDKSRFTAVDLEKPFVLDRQFDCASSLEVAEHVSAEHAEQFVESLTKLAPIVLFSAAIPLQGGYKHINEQWPDYWVELFGRRDYVPVDAIRHRIWHAREICWYTKQNTLLFVRRDRLERFPKLREAYERFRDLPLSLVHPDYFLRAADNRNRSLREIASLLPKTALAAARRFWSRVRGVPGWYQIGAGVQWDAPPDKTKS